MSCRRAPLTSRLMVPYSTRLGFKDKLDDFGEFLAEAKPYLYGIPNTMENAVRDLNSSGRSLITACKESRRRMSSSCSGERGGSLLVATRVTLNKMGGGEGVILATYWMLR